MSDTDLVLLVGRLQARVDALESRLSPEPVTSWRAAARPTPGKAPSVSIARLPGERGAS